MCDEPGTRMLQNTLGPLPEPRPPRFGLLGNLLLFVPLQAMVLLWDRVDRAVLYTIMTVSAVSGVLFTLYSLGMQQLERLVKSEKSFRSAISSLVNLIAERDPDNILLKELPLRLLDIRQERQRAETDLARVFWPGRLGGPRIQAQRRVCDSLGALADELITENDELITEKRRTAKVSSADKDERA